ncbi:hypothetical protein BT96DRAFT_982328 [Gymnopus androsaceus JB14]|uniref:Mid2 domain-containing protein n=1 Tax=Gymnopus androsaceus JB14 TaxID=1447944 RepID=A0A6A4GG97_9AGAR|nr:hypothetical protein BT96DRAFT_982328 [Gymnopus androsaceus JB14]
MKSGIQSFAVLFVLFCGSITALPQASLTLYEFEPVAGTVIGTEFAVPLGTASDGSDTTFLIENIFTTSGLVLVGSSTEVSTATITASETIVVFANDWFQSNFPTSTTAGSTQLGGSVDCFFTTPESGTCLLEEVLDDGTTSTETFTGAPITKVMAISTRTLASSTTPGTTESAAPHSSANSTPSADVDHIVGGVVGGVTGFAAALVFAFLCIRRRQQRHPLRLLENNDGTVTPYQKRSLSPTVSPVAQSFLPHSRRFKRIAGRSTPRSNEQAPRAHTEETPREEMQRDETQRDEMQREETQREETQREETQREETQREETQREETQREETQEEETQREETQIGEEIRQHIDSGFRLPPSENNIIDIPPVYTEV